MSSISQIVALHRRAAQLAQTPVSVSSEVTPELVSATVTLGAVRAPVTYNTRIKRTAQQGSADAAPAEQEPDAATPPAPAHAEAARWWDGTPRPSAPWLDTTA